MGFYNRNPYSPVINPMTMGLGGIYALDTYAEGGGAIVEASFVSGLTAMLAAPAAGMAYRLHSICTPDLGTSAVGNGNGITLFDGGTRFFAALAVGQVSFYMGGIIAPYALSIFNFNTATLRVSLAYDTVQIPVLQ